MKKNLEKVMYMGIGAVIALLSFSFGNIHRDTANAQGEAPIVDLIRCRRLEIVNADGLNKVILSSDEQGGSVDVRTEDNKGGAFLSANEYGGAVGIGGKEEKGIALLYNHKDSAIMDFYGGESQKLRLMMTDEFGGNVLIFGKDEQSGVFLRTDKYGGGIGILNKSGKVVGKFSVSDIGGGMLNTRDKHGYKTGSVP